MSCFRVHEWWCSWTATSGTATGTPPGSESCPRTGMPSSGGTGHGISGTSPSCGGRAGVCSGCGNTTSSVIWEAASTGSQRRSPNHERGAGHASRPTREADLGRQRANRNRWIRRAHRTVVAASGSDPDDDHRPPLIQSHSDPYLGLHTTTPVGAWRCSPTAVPRGSRRASTSWLWSPGHPGRHRGRKQAPDRRSRLGVRRWPRRGTWPARPA